MLTPKHTLFCVLYIIFKCGLIGAEEHLIHFEKDDVQLIVFPENGYLKLNVIHNDVVKLSSRIGVGLDIANITTCTNLEHCLVIENSTLQITSNVANGFQVLWTTTDTSYKFRDCYVLGSGVHWFGGPEQFYQSWPVEKLSLFNAAYVTKELSYMAIVEPYWLNSLGAYIHVDQRVPLFVDQNLLWLGSVCFVAKIESPYINRDKVVLNYTVVATNDPKEGHIHAVQNFLGKPSGHPNYKMIQRPIFSTWARYSKNVSDEVVRTFAEEIIENGYGDSQLELDDYWETCYGSLEFNEEKFANITETVAKVKSLGLRLTLWVHPFVNTNCENYTEIGNANDYFVKNEWGFVLTRWWNSIILDAQHLDFSKAEVRDWFVGRLELLQEEHGIDSFKFDAGESSWPPQNPVLKGDIDLQPNSLTADYVRTCAQFGDLIEVRTGYKTQDLPVFVRMIDKDSTWGDNNGLYTLITTLLQMNMNGYTLVLPDMVGGNGYNGAPDAELYIRWLQANTFMPSIQFSFVPWDFDNDNVTEISKKFVELHVNYTDVIVEAMENSTKYGYPVNPPIWWADPTNSDALESDTQFMLGDVVLVAPVIIQGATSRDVVLPSGCWVDGNNGTVYEGNRTLKNYPAPLDVLPYFTRQTCKTSASSNTERASFCTFLVLVAILNIIL